MPPVSRLVKFQPEKRLERLLQIREWNARSVVNDANHELGSIFDAYLCARAKLDGVRYQVAECRFECTRLCPQCRMAAALIATLPATSANSFCNVSRRA